MTRAPLLAAILISACEQPPADHPREPLPQGTLAAVRTSDLVAGAAPGTAPVDSQQRPPVTPGPVMAAEGEQLYNAMNCTGCHGALGGGGIGPPFADADWIYGGEPSQIFASIAQGRPNGMPSFGGRLPSESIWKVVAYVRTLAPEPAGRGETGGGAAGQ
ncbi:MAG TPA: c-type cytochrome [Gemmatimonadales bacterium]